MLAVLLGGAGVTHFLRPRGYDRIVPAGLPPRITTLASGVAELAVAAGLTVPRPGGRPGGPLRRCSSRCSRPT